MATYGLVTGEFFSHEMEDGKAIPLRGGLCFTPRTVAREAGRLFAPVVVLGHVDKGVLYGDKALTQVGVRLLVPGEGVEPEGWSYKVTGTLYSPEGDRYQVGPFDFELTAAGVDLAQAVQVAPYARVPVVPTGEVGTSGRDGRDGAPGKDGRGVVSISDLDGDGVATVAYTDGSSESLVLPRGLAGVPGPAGPQGEPGSVGAPGADGVGIDTITAEGTSLKIRLTNGSEQTVPLPAGTALEAQDTGWRNLSASFPLRPGWTAQYPGKHFLVRRVGDRVTALLYFVKLAEAITNHTVNMPDALRPDTIFNLKNHTLLTDDGRSFFGKATYWNGSLQIKVHTASTSFITVQWDYTTKDAFPSELPGTAA